MSTIKPASLSVLAMVLSLLGPNAQAKCHADPQRYATEMFSELESIQKADVFESFYKEEFSKKFQEQFSFAMFYSSLTMTQHRLGVGQRSSRSFKSRAFGPPQLVGQAAYNLATHRVEPTNIEIGTDNSVLEFEVFTSASAGKIRQRLQIICAEGKWKVQGVWYLPLG